MSVYFEDSKKVDALAERLLQRAEQRILVDNYYTYEYVANSSNLSGSNVQGSIFAIHDFFYFCINALSVHLVEVHIPLRERIGFKNQILLICLHTQFYNRVKCGVWCGLKKIMKMFVPI